jgi:hypothetical protein
MSGERMCDWYSSILSFRTLHQDAKGAEELPTLCNKEC